MKKLLILVVLMLAGFAGSSQTVKKWTQQKKTQIEYLVNQIVGLRAYAGVLNKGYQMARDGLSMIHKIKEGDFSLHEDHFGSLRRVNPAIQSSSSFQAITTHWQDIQISMNSINRLAGIEGGLTPEERTYARNVLRNLWTLCIASLDDLALVSQNGNLSLTDDERLEQIGKLQKEIADAHGFVRRFEKQVQLLAISRLKERNDQRVLKKLYGIE